MERADRSPARRTSSVTESASYALASARRAEEAAAHATGWVREILGPDVVVRIARLDAAGRLRTVWRHGEDRSDDNGLTTARRIALQTRAYSHFDFPPITNGRRAALFPLVWRENSLGLLEIQADRAALFDRSGMLAAIACQLAGVLAGLDEREDLARQLGTLEELADIGREVLRASGPEEALAIVASALSRDLRAPVAIWWSPETGARALTSLSGSSAAKTEVVMRNVGDVPPSEEMSDRERMELGQRFARAVGVKGATTREAADALVIVASRGPLAQRRIDMIGSLLEDTLPLLGASAREAEHASRLDVGLAWTAHELRSPILGVKAALESVVGRSGPRDEPVLRRSVSDLEKLAAETEGILGWAAGRRELETSVVDVSRLVEDAVASARIMLGPGARIVVDAGSSVTASVDPVHLRAAVVNLIRNAVLYSGRDTVVNVRVAGEGEAVRVTIRDQGPGIPREERATIFDPFVRGREGSRVRDGSGLGLFITRRVVEAHGGRIWIDPAEVGTTFHVLLPVDGREPQRSAS
jgi:signal transduction histidine kinase